MLYRWEYAGVVAYRSQALDALGIPHGFGTRRGDDRAIAEVLGLGDRQWVTVRQVHGHAVHRPGPPPEKADTPEKGDSPCLSGDWRGPVCDADAVVLARPTDVTRILTADCVPILLASTDGEKVAAAHAGWRGLVCGVIEEAVDALGAPFVAAVGPCISAAHFEVGEEVAERFEPRFVRRAPGRKPHVDLRAAAHEVLQHLGARQIDTADRCTYAHEDEFFSHRRDVTHRGNDTTGRMSSVIGAASYARSF